MKKWLIVMSKEAITVDAETIIESPNEPDFWTCQSIADEHGCSFWSVVEMPERVELSKN